MLPELKYCESTLQEGEHRQGRAEVIPVCNIVNCQCERAPWRERGDGFCAELQSVRNTLEAANDAVGATVGPQRFGVFEVMFACVRQQQSQEFLAQLRNSNKTVELDSSR